MSVTSIIDTADRIPQAITALLAVRKNENLDLCGAPFAVEAGHGSGWSVTMYATKHNSGDDVHIQVFITGATGTQWARREWDNALGRMTDWVY